MDGIESGSPQLTLAALLRLHQSLLRRAREELIDAFESIGEDVGNLLEHLADHSELPGLQRSVTKLQAADSVAQRLEHVVEGLALLESLELSTASEETPTALAKVLQVTEATFTIADERALYARIVQGESAPVESRKQGAEQDLELF